MFGNNLPNKITSATSWDLHLYSSTRKDEAKTYNKLHVDENSDQVLRIAIQKCKNDAPEAKLGIRFAFLDWPNRDRQEFRCKVGLRSDAKFEEVEKAKKEYKEKNVVQATKKRSGVVHQELLEKLNEVIGEYPSGGSFSIYFENDTLYINPVNRTAKNSRVFTVNNIGQAIYLFGDGAKFDKANHVFARFDHNLLYDLKRSQPQGPFTKIMELFVEHVKTIAIELGIKNVVINDSLLERNCPSFFKERIFYNLLNVMPEKEKTKTLALMMLRNIYIAAGTESRFNPTVHLPNSQNKTRSGFEQEIKKIFEVAKELKIKLDLNKVPNEFLFYSFLPALGMAAKNGYTELVELLLDNGALVDYPVNPKNATSLFLALGQNEIEVAKLLIARGADPFAETSDSRTPLHVVRNGEGAAMLLAEAKKHNKTTVIDTRDWDGMTPLHHAVLLKMNTARVGQEEMARNAMEVVKTLIEAKANPAIADAKGLTPFHLAVKHEDGEMVQYLLKCVDPKIEESILQCAVDQKNTKILKLLLTSSQLNLIECEKILKRIDSSIQLKEGYDKSPHGFFSDIQRQEYELLKEQSNLLREYIETQKVAKEKSSLLSLNQKND